MVSTIKFSEFAEANLNDSTNTTVGLSGGANAKAAKVTTWTTSTRPSAPFNGLLGYNTDLSQYEYWDNSTLMWFQLGTGDTGTVTLVDTGTGLTGGPITETGTISFAPIAALSLWANTTGGVAVPTVTAISALVNLILPVTATARQMLQSRASDTPVWSTATWPATTTINQILYSSSNNVVGEIATANNAVMSTSGAGLPGFSTVLPSNLTTTDPVLTFGIATKNYVDKTALNGTSVYAASAASLGTVTQSGAGVGATLTNAGVQATFALDGINPPVGVNVLIKNTAVGMTDANEGIYTVTDAGSGASNWVLTRATSYDTVTEINNTGLILVQNGSTLAGTAWYNAATIVTVDTTSFNYNQFGNIIFPITLANGGTSASLTANEGGIFYSTATAGAILAGTATARQMLQSGATAAPAWSTSTWPATTTINRILFSSANNTVSEISTVVSAGLLTDGSGVPGWVTATGTGAPVLGTSPTITTPYINAIADQTYNLPVMAFTGAASAVNLLAAVNSSTGNPVGFQFAGSDSNVNASYATKGVGTHTFFGGLSVGSGYPILSLTPVASAVNYIDITSAITTGSPVISAIGTDSNIYLILSSKGTGGIVLNANGAAVISANNSSSAVNYTTIQGSTTGNALTFTATGTDTNISMSLQSKGTGRVAIQGISTNTAAASGYVGEFLSASNTSGSPITFSTGSAKTLQSITLTAGDWDVWANATCIGTTITLGKVSISTTDNTQADNSLAAFVQPLATSTQLSLLAPQQRFLVSGSTTVYIVCTFTGTGTLSVSGGIYARRRS